MLSLIIGYAVLSLKVAIGLGFVIFVHELGHFMVAKLCGVKCEKFYLGFDFWGLKLCKFRAGETEYGIGIFPLGGYVKMLGQEDNPGKIKEEMERAKEKGEGGDINASLPSERARKSEVTPAFDPRSFLAKSVPKRMAIIAAGVIMNVIFAFLMAVVAVSPWMGVPTPPCVLGDVFAGDPAWKADLRPGDKVLTIAGKPMRQFRDLMTAISLGDIDPKAGVPIEVQRPGVAKPFTVTVKPDRSIGRFFIGVAPPTTTSLVKNQETWLVRKRLATVPGSAANRAGFHCGDRIVQINNTPIDGSGRIQAELARTADQSVNVVVERTINDAKGKPTAHSKRVTVPVAPNPMRELGLEMKMGEILALQDGSPALAAGIKPGDQIIQIDGSPVLDPMRLPDQLDRRAGQTVKVTIHREGRKAPIEISVRLRQPNDVAPPGVASAVDVSSLGAAYTVLNTVDRVVPGSPAAKAGLQAGDSIVRAKIIPSEKALRQEPNYGQGTAVLPVKEGVDTWWPTMMAFLPQCLPDTTVELSYVRAGAKEPLTAKITPVEATDWHSAERGFIFEPMTFDLRADSIPDAVALGGRETLDSLTMVFRTVQKISTNQVSLRQIAGPWSIITAALHYADQGSAVLLLFLTLLSANLAIINFLPIPVLDGGHFVLLCYEGIRGKPAPESVQVVLSYIGLILVLAIMIWGIGLDAGVFSRR